MSPLIAWFVGMIIVCVCTAIAEEFSYIDKSSANFLYCFCYAWPVMIFIGAIAAPVAFAVVGTKYIIRKLADAQEPKQ